MCRLDSLGIAGYWPRSGEPAAAPVDPAYRDLRVSVVGRGTPHYLKFDLAAIFQRRVRQERRIPNPAVQFDGLNVNVLFGNVFRRHGEFLPVGKLHHGLGDLRRAVHNNRSFNNGIKTHAGEHMHRRHLAAVIIAAQRPGLAAIL